MYLATDRKVSNQFVCLSVPKYITVYFLTDLMQEIKIHDAKYPQIRLSLKRTEVPILWEKMLNWRITRWLWGTSQVNGTFLQCPHVEHEQRSFTYCTIQPILSSTSTHFITFAQMNSQNRMFLSCAFMPSDRVAQLDRAPAFWAVGHRFKSCIGRLFLPLLGII